MSHLVLHQLLPLIKVMFDFWLSQEIALTNVDKVADL
jgi:hypothetical protein